MEVPHSARVVDCYDCATLGRRRCWSCFGNGEVIVLISLYQLKLMKCVNRDLFFRSAAMFVMELVTSLVLKLAAQMRLKGSIALPSKTVISVTVEDNVDV